MSKIAITSIAPGGRAFENQFKAISSWTDHGFKVLSINHQSEIDQLKDRFPKVEFVPTERTNLHLFGKHYVTISAIIDYLKTRKEEKFLLINSDIIIYDSWSLEKEIFNKADTGIVALHRYNFSDDLNIGKYNDGGIDAFLINKKFLSIFPQTILCLGQCFWDYWLPYQAVLNKVKVHTVNKAYIFHKDHGNQWSERDYQVAANIFRAEVGALDPAIKSNMTAGQMSQYVYNQIEAQYKT